MKVLSFKYHANVNTVTIVVDDPKITATRSFGYNFTEGAWSGEAPPVSVLNFCRDRFPLPKKKKTS